MRELLALFSAFAQVSIGTFGGGLSSLPLIEYQLVAKYGWLSTDQFSQLIALSQVTPGPISINAATFVGFMKCGFFGSLVSTFSIIIVPLSTLWILLFFLKKISAESSNKFNLLLRPIVSGLLSLSLIVPLSATLKNGSVAIMLFCAALLLFNYSRIFKENPHILLLLCGIMGIFFL